MNTFLVNHPSNIKHDFLFRQGEPGSEGNGVFRLGSFINMGVNAVRNHDQLVFRKPESPPDMRNHIAATADHLPSLIRKPRLGFMNHLFCARVKPIPPTDLSRVHGDQERFSENML